MGLYLTYEGLKHETQGDIIALGHLRLYLTYEGLKPRESRKAIERVAVVCILPMRD